MEQNKNWTWEKKNVQFWLCHWQTVGRGKVPHPLWASAFPDARSGVQSVVEYKDDVGVLRVPPVTMTGTLLWPWLFYGTSVLRLLLQFSEHWDFLVAVGSSQFLTHHRHKKHSGWCKVQRKWCFKIEITILNSGKTNSGHVGPCVIKFRLRQEAKAFSGQVQEPQPQRWHRPTATPALGFLPAPSADVCVPFPCRPSSCFVSTCPHFWLTLRPLLANGVLLDLHRTVYPMVLISVPPLSSKHLILLRPSWRRNAPLFLTHRLRWKCTHLYFLPGNKYPILGTSCC